MRLSNQMISSGESYIGVADSNTNLRLYVFSVSNSNI